jgi:hypothetical protein
MAWATKSLRSRDPKVRQAYAESIAALRRNLPPISLSERAEK